MQEVIRTLSHHPHYLERRSCRAIEPCLAKVNRQIRGGAGCDRSCRPSILIIHEISMTPSWPHIVITARTAFSFLETQPFYEPLRVESIW